MKAALLYRGLMPSYFQVLAAGNPLAEVLNCLSVMPLPGRECEMGGERIKPQQ